MNWIDYTMIAVIVAFIIVLVSYTKVGFEQEAGDLTPRTVLSARSMTIWSCLVFAVFFAMFIFSKNKYAAGLSMVLGCSALIISRFRQQKSDELCRLSHRKASRVMVGIAFICLIWAAYLSPFVLTRAVIGITGAAFSLLYMGFFLYYDIKGDY